MISFAKRLNSKAATIKTKEIKEQIISVECIFLPAQILVVLINLICIMLATPQ